MLRTTGLLAAFLFILVLFQNFDLLNARVLSPIDPSDIRVGAPVKRIEKTVWAQPATGTDLNSVGGDWAGRQAHLLLNGADDRLLADANSTLDRIFGRSKSEASLREPSSDPGSSENDSVFSPRSLHMARIGQIEMSFQGDTKLACEFRGGDSEFSLSRPIKPGVDLKLQHETKDAASTLQLHVSW